MGVRTVCVKVEQKNAKQNNRTWLEGLLTIREYLEEGKLVVGVASVACVVFTASQYLLFLASSRNTVRGCKFFQILPCIVPSVELV